MIHELLLAINANKNQSFQKMLQDFNFRLTTSFESLSGMLQGYSVKYDETKKCYVRDFANFVVIGGASSVYNTEISMRRGINFEIIAELKTWMKDNFSKIVHSQIDNICQELQQNSIKNPNYLLDVFSLKSSSQQVLLAGLNERITELKIKTNKLAELTNEQQKDLEKKLKNLILDPKFTEHKPTSQLAIKTAEQIKKFVNEILQKNNFNNLVEQWKNISEEQNLTSLINVFTDEVAKTLRALFQPASAKKIDIANLNTMLFKQKLLAREIDKNKQSAANLMQYKLKELSSLEKNFLQIEEALNKPYVDETCCVELKACSCIPDAKRQKISQFIAQELSKKDTDTVNLVSIGSAQLKQELITAEALMKKGKNVNFVLIEPSYYMSAMGYDKLDFQKLKQAFDLQITTLQQKYKKTCNITDVYPSTYAYLNNLYKGNDLKSLSELRQEVSQFIDNADERKIFLINSTSTDQELIKSWHKENPKDILLIRKAKDKYSVAMATDVNNPNSLIIKGSNKISDALVKAPLQHTQQDENAIESTALIEVDTPNWRNSSNHKALFGLLKKKILVIAAEQMRDSLESIAKEKQNAPPLPDAFMVVDSNDFKISNHLKKVDSFFERTLEAKVGKPVIFNFERDTLVPNIEPQILHSFSQKQNPVSRPDIEERFSVRRLDLQ